MECRDPPSGGLGYPARDSATLTGADEPLKDPALTVTVVRRRRL